MRLKRKTGYVLLAVLALTTLLWWLLGIAEGTAIAGGLVLVSATAWLSPRGARLAGSLLAGVVVGGIGRAAGGVPLGVALGISTVAVAYLFAGERILRRFAFLVPSLVLLIFTTTLLMYHAPGNPFAGERFASPQVERALRAHYGVPESATEFFAIYMRRLVVEGSLGPAIKVQGRNVEDLLAAALPVSAALGLLALVLACALGLVLGIRAGLKPNSLADHSSMAVSMIGISLPNFVIGAGLVIVFSLELEWLPVAGWGGFRHLWMPALTLALPYAAYIARLARSGTIDVMQQDFIRTARAKGVSESAVVLRHALRGAILPVVSFLGPAAAGIMTGSFVVETLFGIPGMGQWFVKGAVNRDYSVVLGTALVYTSLITVLNLAVDLAYAGLDPRIRSDL